ncbi:MAG TPA: hypothetical protein P5081_08270 [Phycisphaerae bacterium]|nr:hypothetical protein [Phycisphaerae bacterium]HRW52868.1 hypothetical protein [Phycisphaerae bacterium]
MLKNTKIRRNSMIATAMSMALLGTSTSVFADGGRNRRGHRDADLDVSARLSFNHGGAILKLKIDAEIEGRFLRDAYNVVVTIEPADNQFGRRAVRPQTLIIPLNRPSEIDRHEIEFRRRLSVALPHNLARFGNNLVVRAKLVSASSGHVLDRDTTFVTSDLQTPRRGRHRGPRFGGVVIR